MGMALCFSQAKASSISVNTPSVLITGASYNISWQASGTTGLYAIYICRGQTRYVCNDGYRIASPVTGNSYSWTVPSFLPTNDYYRINVYDWGYEGSDTLSAFSGYFTITNNSIPTLSTYTYPTLDLRTAFHPVNSNSPSIVSSVTPTIQWKSSGVGLFYVWEISRQTVGSPVLASGVTNHNQITVPSDKLSWDAAPSAAGGINGYNFKIKICADIYLDICSGWSQETEFRIQGRSIDFLSSNSERISYNNPVTLSWDATDLSTQDSTATNLNICSAEAFPSNSQWTGEKAISGSQVINNITEDTIFALTCRKYYTGGGFNQLLDQKQNALAVNIIRPYFPAAPTSPKPADKESIDTATINLSWTNVIMPDGWYNLYYKKKSDFSWVEVSNIKDSFYSLLNIFTNSDYSWRVQSCNSENFCNDSAIWSFSVSGTSNVAPTTNISDPITNVITTCDSTSYITQTSALNLTSIGTKSNMCGLQYYKVVIPKGKVCDLEWTLQSDSKSDYDLYTNWKDGTLDRNNFTERSVNGKGKKDELATKGLSFGDYYAMVYREAKDTNTGIYSITSTLTNCTAETITVKEQKAGTNSDGSWCYTFTTKLKYKDTGYAVGALQAALQKEGLLNIQKLTTYFGSATQQAVIKFQEKYKNEILTPINLTEGTGYVGTATIKKLNELYGCK